MSGKIEGQFMPLPHDLLKSQAWHEALQHTYVMSLLYFLVREHLRHGGKENGNLVAPYSQLQSYSDAGGRIRTPEILPTIEKAQKLGLARVMPGGHRKGPSRYALTWLPTYDGKTPTRDYLSVTPEAIREIVELGKQRKRRSTSWTKATVPRGWRKPRETNGKSKPAVTDGTNSMSKPPPYDLAQTASQFAGANSKPIGVLKGANSKSVPHGANSKCYLESLDQEGGRLEGKEIRGVEAGARVEDGCSCSVRGNAAVANAAEPPAGKGGLPQAQPALNPGKAPYSRCGFRIVTPLGARTCGMLAPMGSDRCVDHASWAWDKL